MNKFSIRYKNKNLVSEDETEYVPMNVLRYSWSMSDEVTIDFVELWYNLWQMFTLN